MRIPLAIILSALCAFSGNAGEPATAVLEVLKKAKVITKGSAMLEELSVSPYCGKRKRDVISKQWTSLLRWTKSEDAEFKVLVEKVDGDLAGVIIAAKGNDGPDGGRVLNFGVRSTDEGWLVAPVAGVFTNSGIGFGSEELARAKAIEQWMARESIKSFANFKAQELTSYLKTLAGKVDPKVLKEATAKEAFDHFMSAVKDGGFERVMVWLGMLERRVGDDRNWKRMMAAAASGLAGDDQRKVWRLLTEPSVIRVMMGKKEKDDTASVLMGFMAPFISGLDRERNRVIRFNLFKTPAGWRLKMPAYFSRANDESASHFTAHREELDWDDEKFKNQLGEVFETQNKARRAESPEALLKEVEKKLEARNYADFARLLYRHPADAKEKVAGQGQMERYDALGEWWSSFFGMTDGRRQFNRDDDGDDEQVVRAMHHHVDGGVALGVLRLEALNSWKPRFAQVWMTKVEGGWAVVTDSTLFKDEKLGEGCQKSAELLDEKFEEEKGGLQEKYLADLVVRFSKLAEAGEAPDEAETQKIVAEWRKGLAGGSVTMMFEKAAVLEIPEKSTKLINNLVATMKGVKSAKNPDQVLGARSAGRFHAVSMMVDAGRGIEMHCPLILVVPTEKGPRVLVDVELWYPSNFGKKTRNGAMLLRLKKVLSEEDYTAVRELFEWNTRLAGPVWEKWEKENE
ncbi:hypothetical protein N9F50_00160 [Akkermansiaceae bacterium]|nr:hypothetical protein [Akkermansiaceae bacterium]